MKTAEINTSLIEGYMHLLNNLSADNKLDLISRLSTSVKEDLTNKKSIFKNSFGAFQSEKTAEEIINEIRSSRTFNRETEAFLKII